MTELDLKLLKTCAQTCAVANIRRSSRAITKFYSDFMSETGLEPTQYSLLVACALSKGMTVSNLAEAFAMDRTTLTRNLSLMTKNGLLTTEKGRDRRSKIIKITKSGELALAKAAPIWRNAQDAIESKFGTQRLSELISEMRILVDIAQTSNVKGT